uniref:Uncharacterized protein n=1 Tax=Panagrolaimus sp. ES5 TaxID=591445 RepID=A0AC34FJB0_9BILA
MTRYNKNGFMETVVGFNGIITWHSLVQECSDGFSRYLATTIDHCSYYYCAAMLQVYQPNGKDGGVERRSTNDTIPMSSTVSKPSYIDRTLAMK